MAASREERLALNEALFRIANERMAAWEERQEEAGEAGEAGEAEPYHCECANQDCRQKVWLRRDAYERIRGDSAHFVIVPGHEVPDIETVIERHDGWVVIEKAPEVRDIVEAADPRNP